MCVLIGRHVCLDESMCTQLRHFRFARILEKYFTKALEQFVRVYIPSFKSLEERAGGGGVVERIRYANFPLRHGFA